MQYNKILVIQTAFIGDAVLATALLEKLHSFYPEAEIDLMVRRGNEALFREHPFLHEALVWDKRNKKYARLLQLMRKIRKRRYAAVINLQRFAATGFVSAFSKAGYIAGFRKNPFSFMYTHAFPHPLGHKGDANYLHETERNQKLIASITDEEVSPMKLYPSQADLARVQKYKEGPYITIAPASVWHTKQLPQDKWIQFVNTVPQSFNIYIIGGPADQALCCIIKEGTFNFRVKTIAGQLSLLETAALMKDAAMNYVNDSAPMHIASAMNAPVTAVYCSTIPEFGFGPLSDERHMVQIKEDLDCRPCGLHGYSMCPLEHFKCAHKIQVSQLLATLPVLQ